MDDLSFTLSFLKEKKISRRRATCSSLDFDHHGGQKIGGVFFFSSKNPFFNSYLIKNT
jgi:hypothetical protein